MSLLGSSGPDDRDCLWSPTSGLPFFLSGFQRDTWLPRIKIHFLALFVGWRGQYGSAVARETSGKPS